MSTYGVSVFQTGQNAPVGTGTLTLNSSSNTYSLSFTQAGKSAVFFEGKYSQTTLKGQSVVSLADAGISNQTKINQVIGTQGTYKGAGIIQGCFSILNEGVEITGLLIALGA